ncbi:hypothetical protein Tco_1407164 [Tanacetum coccineum]
MAKEDPLGKVAIVPKFDMPYHVFTMSPKDVKSLAKQYSIPLDLHPCAPVKGWTMDKLLEEVIGRAIIQCMIGDIIEFLMFNGSLPDDGFSILDVRALAEKFIDLRLVPADLLFKAGLASTWDFPGFHPIFKDTKGNVVTMSEYPRFPFLFGASIVQGLVVSNKNQIDQNTTPPLPVCHPIPDKTDFQREVEVEDPKVLAIKERKARAAAKKKENKKRDKNERKAPNPKQKGRKFPLSGRANRLLLIIRPLNAEKEEVFISYPSLTRHSVHHSPSFVKTLSQSGRNLIGLHADEGESYRLRGIYVPEWSILRRCRIDSPMWCWELMVHLAPLATQEESNALTNPDDYGKLAETHGECSNIVLKLVTARQDLEQNARLYTNMSDHYKGLKEEHQGCNDRFQVLEKEKNELSMTNRDQALQIQELEAELAKKTLHLYMLREYRPKGPWNGRNLLLTACDYRHSVADLLKVHPDPAPFGGFTAPNVSSAPGGLPS